MKELKNRDIPYKIYLSEDEMPRYWYNVRADMKTKPAPLLNPGTLKPMTLEATSYSFASEVWKKGGSSELSVTRTPGNWSVKVLRRGISHSESRAGTFSLASLQTIDERWPSRPPCASSRTRCGSSRPESGRRPRARLHDGT